MNLAPDEARIAVIIEDEDDIRDLLETVLAQAGFQTIATRSGMDGIRAVQEHSPLITTLDVSMPGMDGFEAAKRIRSFSSTYIFMLTARADEIDTLQGLEAGADDYITKPFRPRELRARIDAVLRRHRTPNLADGFQEPQDIRLDEARVFVPRVSLSQIAPVVQGSSLVKDAALNTATPAVEMRVTAQDIHHTVPVTPPIPAPVENVSEIVPHAIVEGVQVTLASATVAPAPVATVTLEPSPAAEGGGDYWMEHNGLRMMPEMRLAERDGEELSLTRTEFDLMASLMTSQRRVRSKADLALLLRGESYVTAYFVNEADKRAVETHISNLRRKLGDGLSAPRWVETVRGVGYRLAAVQSR